MNCETSYEFQDILGAVIEAARRESNYSRFYRATAFTVPGGARHTDSFIAMEARFWNPQNTTICVEFFGGTVAAPVLVKEPLWSNFELVEVPTRISFSEAVTQLTDEGWEEPFSGVELSHPLSATIMEPRYVFDLSCDGKVAVGAQTGTVTKEALL